MRAYITGVQRRTPARAARTPAGDPLEFGAGVRESCAGVPRVGRWSPGRSSLESGRANSALRVLALWSSVFSIPDSSDFARTPADHPRSSDWSPVISDRSPAIHPLESSDFGLESGVQSARAWSSGDGGERITVRRPVRPNEAASTAEDPLLRPREPRERRGARQVGVLERVARPPPAPSLNRLLGEGLDGTFKRSRSIRGCSHRSGRRNNPQQGSSSRLCRVHPALVQ